MTTLTSEASSPSRLQFWKWNKKQIRTFGKQLVPYILILPVIIYYVAFWFRPVVTSVFGAFTTPEGQFTLENFQLVFNDPVFMPALTNTAIIVLFSVTLEFLLALLLALLINRKFPGSGLFLFLALIPMALPAAAVGAMWITGLTAHGWMNSLLYYLGILEEGDKIYWLAGSRASLLAVLIVLDAWTVIPSVMIILLAGLQNIPPETHEAGYVFGGNYFTVTTKITLPMIRSTIQTAVILRLIAAIQIWLVIVLLLGYSRLPVLLERVVYYTKEVEVFVSLAALLYLYFSGAFRKDPEAE